MSNNNTHSAGPGFCSLLALLFIGLKLTANITWSWWWVLSPLWIGFAVLVPLVILIAVLTKKGY